MPSSPARDLPRVLVLTAYYHPFQGGIETHARTLVAYLAGMGVPVQVVTRRADDRAPAREVLDGVPVHRVGPAGPRTGWRKWLMLAPAFAKLVALRRDIDLIYCPGYQGIGLAAIAAGLLLGRPVILRSGNLGVLRGDNWDAPISRWGLSPDAWVVRWLKRRVGRLYQRADGFVCNCRAIEQEALECGVPRSAVHYLPNAVDVHVFRPAAPDERARVRSATHWPAHATVVLYVGRLSTEKGVLDPIDAWREASAPGRLLVLVGPDMPGNPMDAGPLARQRVAEYGLSDSVRFHGASSEPAALLRGADVYVLPSHYEAFSNALIEAMSTGLPVVATGVGGVLDCVTDRHNGRLVPPSSPRALAATLNALLGDSAEQERLGREARLTVERQFEREMVFRRFATLFIDTARGRPSSL